MRTLQSSPPCLSDALIAAGDLSGCFFADRGTRVALSDLVAGSAIDGRGDELEGRSVLLLITDQLTAALVLLELDGIVQRIVLCPPDVSLEYLTDVIESAEVDAIVSDRTSFGPGVARVRYIMPCSHTIVPRTSNRNPQFETEWILLTSGTTGPPKLVVHTLASLAGVIKPGRNSSKPVIWSTFYDIRRYGGLQIFLRAVFGGASLVLSCPDESTAGYLARINSNGVTHCSGTPSHWRRALMSSSMHLIKPEYIRLSGEIADQAILNQLRSMFPEARIVHGFASTEAGVAFEVTDGLAGFPVEVIENTSNVEMKIVDDCLRIRSGRNATRYLGTAPRNPLKDTEGFVDTSDVIELREGRYYFLGRRDGVINVGGQKVHPEEVEAVINRHPKVDMSRVRTKKNPITGALVVADVVLKNLPDSTNLDLRELQHGILMFCHHELPSYKIPGAIYFVPTLVIAESGKLERTIA